MPYVWRVGLVELVYSLLIAFLIPFYEEAYALLPVVDHPYAVQSFGVLLAFSVTFRTNISWSRYWEACTHTQFMWSKWGDSFMQLQAFINSSERKYANDRERVEELEHCRQTLVHWFSMMSALATDRLIRGDINRMEVKTRLVRSRDPRLVREPGQSSFWDSLVIRRELLNEGFSAMGEPAFNVIPLKRPDFSSGNR